MMFMQNLMRSTYRQRKSVGMTEMMLRGGEQLVHMETKDESAKVLILINHTDKFSAEAQALAEQESVVLLNGDEV